MYPLKYGQKNDCALSRQLIPGENALKSLAGADMRKMFGYPYSFINGRMIAGIKEAFLDLTELIGSEVHCEQLNCTRR